MCHWRSLFRLFLEEFKVFVGKHFIGHIVPFAMWFIRFVVLLLLVFIFAGFICLQHWSPLWYAIDMCFGCTCLCVETFGTVLSRYCEFSKKNWLLFCDWSLDFCRSKVYWILYVVFHFLIFFKWQIFKSFMPGCIIGHFLFSLNCSTFANICFT